MPLPQFSTADPALTREKALSQIIYSIALEECSLSHLINAESEKIQYALGTIPGQTGIQESVTIADLLALNKSVRAMLEGTLQNQMILKSKMSDALAAYKMPCAFLSSYMEALGDEQTIPQQSFIVFDPQSIDSEGLNIELSDDGRVFTLTHTGLYQVEWNINLADGDYTTPAVVGILENGEPASGASCSGTGSFSSGTLMRVDSVPFTLSLFNHGEAISLSRHAQYIDSAASIRIVRFADGASS